MSSVSVRFDPEVVAKAWLNTIIDLAKKIIADEFGALSGIDSASLGPSGASEYAVGFVINDLPLYPMIPDGDEVARRIGDRIVYDFTNTMALEARIDELRSASPIRGFVKLEFDGRSGFSTFTIDGANPDCRQGQGLNH